MDSATIHSGCQGERVVRMSELSEASGVAVPTIKFYLREGLLPAGVRTAANQARYDDGHLRRLRLIRALVEIGDISLATVAAVLAAVDDERRSTHEVLGMVHHALAMRGPVTDPATDIEDTMAEVDAFVEAFAWHVDPSAPARRELARVLVTLRRLGWKVDASVFDRYARAADQLAAWEIQQTPPDASRAQTVEGVVVGTVVFEAALLALRRLAEEHHSAVRFNRADGPNTNRGPNRKA